MSEERKTNLLKPTYEDLEKSRSEWKSLASTLVKYLSIMENKDGDRDVLVSDLVTISQWNAKHIDEIAELKQALTGRTVSCGNCNAMAKERDEARAMMVTLCHKVVAAALSEEAQATPMPPHEFREATQQDVERLMNNPIIKDIKFKAVDDGPI